MSFVTRAIEEGRIKTLSFSFSSVDKSRHILRIFRSLSDQVKIINRILRNEWKNLKTLLSLHVDLKIPTAVLRSRYDEEEGESDNDEIFDGVSCEDLDIVDVQNQLNQYLCLITELKIEMKGRPTSLEILLHRLSPVLEIEKSFIHFFVAYVRNMIFLAIDHPKTIKTLSGIIQRQETMDKSMKKKYEGLSRPLRLKEIFFSEIEKSIYDQYFVSTNSQMSVPESSEVRSHGYSPTENPNIILENRDLKMTEIFRLMEESVGYLSHVQQRISKHFPKKEYPVTDQFITSTYLATKKYLSNYITRNLSSYVPPNNSKNRKNNPKFREKLDNSQKLKLIHWIRKTYTKLFLPYTEFIKVSDFRKLVEALEDDFISCTSDILTEWSDNIVSTIFKKIKINDFRPIQIRENDPLYTSGPKELFDIIAEYTQPVVDFDLRDLLIRVMLTVKSMVLTYIQNVRDHFASFREQIGPVSNSKNCFYSLIPLINDFTNLEKYLKFKKSELQNVGMIKDEKYFRWMDREIPLIVEKYSEECFNFFLRYVYNDLQKNGVKKLFTKEWSYLSPPNSGKLGNNSNSVSGVTEILVKKMESYVDDIQYLETKYRKMVNLEEYIVREYVKCLHNKRRRTGFMENEIEECMDRDVIIFKHSFRKKYVKALEYIHKLFLILISSAKRSTKEEQFLSTLNSLLKRYPDVPKFFVVEMIKKAPGVSVSSSRGILRSVEILMKKKKGRGFGVEDDFDEEKTFFSRIEWK